jgi:lipopolysaccharide transport system ATP-binding protein
MATAIKVENLSKIYRLGEIGTGTISRDIERFVKTKILKQEDPFLKIGETNDRSTKGVSDIVYSLKDINFEIEQGDAVGIIGRNGAGKSTLLKILSRVTSPTTGKINIKGRVASLLEVGTGFHPELTGRENIYLNGAILGMRKREIDRKLDEIIEFSGVERYIDTPVKRYSSGMYVRLAFAVAAHLESEILIVDEVLAVGDAEFQKKCLGKMGEVSKGEGRTVLFVSHNMGAVKSLCNNGILLKDSQLVFFEKIDKIVDKYFNSFVGLSPTWKMDKIHNSILFFNAINILDSKNQISGILDIKKPFSININFTANVQIEKLQIAIRIINSEGMPLLTTANVDESLSYELVTPGTYKYSVLIPEYLLKSGKYYIIAAAFEPGLLYQSIENKVSFIVEDTGSHHTYFNDGRIGVISPLLSWKKELQLI